MTTPVSLREFAQQRLLVKRAACAHNRIAPTFSAAMHSVQQCFTSNGARMSSTPIAVYLQWGDSDCEIAVGCHVEGNVNLTGGCEWLDLTGGTHAFASHFGLYETLGETHAAIMEWCKANGRNISGPCFERYPTDPGQEPDPGKWQTDVFYPVAN